MTWLFTIGGLIFGGLAWGFPGALVVGFLGWLVGFIISAQRKPSNVVPADAGTQAQPLTI